MQNKKETGFRRMEQNLTDVIKESQIKLGYDYSAFRLYYPLASLNHTFGTNKTTPEMLEYLEEFGSFVEPRLGKLSCDARKDRFSILIPADGVKYVHEETGTSEFLVELVQQTGRPDCTLEQAEAVFHRYSDHVVRKDMDDGEFDRVLYFEDGIPDDYIYCFHGEGDRVIYHRFGREDYEDFWKS